MTVETAELRALQARAYAPGGELSAEERERLHELQEQRRRAQSGVAPDAAVAVSEASAPREDRQTRQDRRIEEELPDPAPSPVLAEEEDAGDESASAPPPTTRHRLRTSLAGIGLVIIGVAIGWLGPLALAGAGQSLTAEQQERRATIAEEEAFDENSLELVAEEDGVRVWAAARRDGETTCVVADADDRHSTSCIGTAQFFENRYVSASIVVEDSDRGLSETVEAILAPAMGGQFLAMTYRFDHDSRSFDWLSQFPEDARPFAEQLVADGYEMYSLQIVGEFRGEPVWTAVRMDPHEQCLIIPDAVSCAPEEQARESGLTALAVTGRPEAPELHSLTLNFAEYGQSYLTIRTLDEGEFTSVTIDSETGEATDPTRDDRQ